MKWLSFCLHQPLERYPMNVLVFASRKGGSGKSTLAAHLAAYIHKPTRPCLLVDADPHGSLTLWPGRRPTRQPPPQARHCPRARCRPRGAARRGPLTLWRALRRTGEPPLKAGTRGIADIVKQAKQDG